ncbi:unnamed protein product [Rhizopus stolonifer]
MYKTVIIFLDNPYNFYDDNSFMNFDMHHTSQSLPTSFFPPPDDFQQSILFSDPNFLRQQQLLEKAEMDTKVGGMAKEEVPSAVRSNLSAMLDQQQQQQPQQQQQQRFPQQPKIKLEPIPKKKTQLSKPTAMNMGEGSVDHQRRFSELQARFRINYNKKTPKQQLEDSTMLNRRKSLLDPSHNKNILKLNNRDVKKMNNSNTSTKKMMPSPTAASGMTIPNNSNTDTFFIPGAHSLPSRTMPIQIQRVQRANANQPFDLEQRQKRLDDLLVKVDFNDITVSELKEMLRQRGKPATGKKAVLLQRLQEERNFIQHARANGIHIANRYLNPSSPVMDSSSLPESMLLSSSPASLGSLNRSIADMHIGSPPPSSLTIPPPVNSNRRFTPYISPRIPSASPSFSSSVPTSGYLYKKSYAPFTSSALATPDREEDYNPFDNMSEMNNTNTMLEDNMEWTDPTLEVMLQQQQGSAPKFTDEEIMSFLANQGLDSLNSSHNYFHQQPLEDYMTHRHL